MVQFVVAAFLVAHGLVHPAVYAAPKNPAKPMPFDPSHSWALSLAGVHAEPAHDFSVAASWVVALLYGMAGVALLADLPAWVGGVFVAAVAGVAFKVVYFHPWLTVGVLLDLGVLFALANSWPASLF